MQTRTECDRPTWRRTLSTPGGHRREGTDRPDWAIVTEHRAWAPLRTRAFRALWIANLVSNVGTVMHTVGAGWAMTSLTASPAVVALAQVAWSVPGFLFALPAGALADLFDRRVVMRASQIVAMCIAALFGVLHLTGHLGVVALLAGTFLLSVSLTLSAPIFSA